MNNNSRQQLIENFEKELAMLNEHQRQAVELIQGPVMVIAGPGTGKTQILAARIGKILQKTDALPENILCLTYTDAGAVAMRRRLQQFIGADAYRIKINTFHAFCNDIIQDNLYLFEKREMEPVSDLERLELIKKIVEGLEKDNPLKRYSGNIYYEVPLLTGLYSVIKREGWSPGFMLKTIEEYLEELPYREEFRYKTSSKGNYRKGDLKQKEIDKEKEKMGRTAAAIRTFDTYQKLMNESSRYDFDDMINWVLKAFENHPDLLASYRERFQYILVDEFQDTNGSQNALLSRLLGDDDQPNVFVVGDDDQAIFRFQGANVKNMADFALKYKEHLSTVVLSINYRSVQPILDVSQVVIRQNKERLVNKLKNLEKILTAGHPDLAGLQIEPQLHCYANPFAEMAGIANVVEELVKEKGIPPEEIAIIYRKNKYGEELSHYFQLKNIPFNLKKKTDLFKEPFAQKLLHILEYIARETETPYSGDGLLFEILHYNLFGIAPIEVANLSVDAAQKGYKEKTSMRALLQKWIETKNPTLFELRPSDKLIKAGRMLEKWIADAYNVTLLELIENIIREGGFIRQALDSEDKIWLMQVLTAFFDFVKRETRRNPDLRINGLINTIELMQRNNLSIEINRIMESEKGVNLLTAHGAKGLEYEYVFLAGCEAKNWEKQRRNSFEYKLPDNLLDLPLNQEEKEEERRLFFVAITRAKKHLYLSWPKESNDGKELEPSGFIAEIKDGIALPEKEIVQLPEQLVEFASLNFMKKVVPRLEAVERQYVNSLLDNFSMNVTALNNYLDCPLKFYYNNLLRVPSVKSEATEFGSAVHHALEHLFRRMKENNNVFLPVEAFLKDFTWYMNLHRESFTKEAFSRRMEYGHIILKNYYEHYLNSWNKIVVVEQNFKNILVQGIPLKGKLDKLEFDGNKVNVVDYKTGNVERRETKEKLLPPDDKNPHGGHYWRQAVFYKILLDHYKLKDWRAVSTEFDFIEPNKKKEYIKNRIEITPEDVQIVMGQITNTWQRIQHHDFYTGCGEEDCYWCNFTKEHQLYAALEEEN